jgi:hypothetical protein
MRMIPLGHDARARPSLAEVAQFIGEIQEPYVRVLISISNTNYYHMALYPVCM